MVKCPHCKKQIELPEDRELWMKLGEQRLFKKINKVYSGSKPLTSKGVEDD